MRIAIIATEVKQLVMHRLNLIRALLADGHEVVAIAPQDLGQVERLTDMGAKFAHWTISRSGTNPLREIGYLWALRSILRTQGVQLVLSHTPKANLHSMLAALSCRLRFIPNISGLGSTFLHKNWVSKVVELLYRLTLRRAHKVFFQNPDDMGLFIQKDLVYSEQSICLPGSGVDLSRFTMQSLPDHAPFAPVFLMIARVIRDKGVVEFVDAAREVLRCYPQAQFQLLGSLDNHNPSGIPHSQVKLWESEGVLTYKEQTDDVRSFLIQADCVVLPSYREGIPRVLLEAAAMGRPLITTNAPGCRETVINGVTGWVCHTADASDLARCMLSFIATPLGDRMAMARRGRQFIETKFDERIVLQTYLREVEILQSNK